MTWLVPGWSASIVVFVRLAGDSSLEPWLSHPALVLAGGVTLLFTGLVMVPILVLTSWHRGDRRRAQSLRREFHSYPTLALVSLSLALMLLAVPLMFAPPPQDAAPPPRTLAGPRGHRFSASVPERIEMESEPEVLPFDDVPADPPKADPVPAPVPPPPSAPATPAPSVQEPPVEFVKTPVPTPAAELPSGQELSALKFRPDFESPDPFGTVVRGRKGLDRGGLPGGEDADEWRLPELQIDLTIVPDSPGWHGAIYGTTIDVPVLRDTSIRSTYFFASLNDQQGTMDLEASVAWHRATLEVEQRLAGYTRKATFDIAIRGGVSLDRLVTHEADLSVSSAVRPAPWAGMEIGIWAEDGMGLVAQAGHSFAVRIDENASSVTDLRIELKIDLSEKVSFQVGWRYLALRIHDRGAVGGVPFDELERSCSGPIAGLGVRF